MEKKIYIIEYQGKTEHYNDYALTLEQAEQCLTKKGYNKIQNLDESQNNAGLFIRPETEFFAEQKARIISRNLLPCSTHHSNQ